LQANKEIYYILMGKTIKLVEMLV